MLKRSQLLKYFDYPWQRSFLSHRDGYVEFSVIFSIILLPQWPFVGTLKSEKLLI